MDINVITYRNIEERDNKELADLIRTVFREFKIDRPGTVYFDPTTDNLYRLFRTPGSVYWIAEEKGIMAGGCGIYPTPGLPEGCAELVKLYLLPQWRSKGIGRALMEKCFESARGLGYKQLYFNICYIPPALWKVCRHHRQKKDILPWNPAFYIHDFAYCFFTKHRISYNPEGTAGLIERDDLRDKSCDNYFGI